MREETRILSLKEEANKFYRQSLRWLEVITRVFPKGNAGDFDFFLDYNEIFDVENI